jgi:hypothetical protein
MSKQSENIKATFKNIITIYNTTASLLLDVGSLLEKNGYTCLHGNTLGTEQSKDINWPSYWITPYASRYFAATEKSEEIKAVGLFFVDASHDPIDPIILIASFKPLHDKTKYYYGKLRDMWFSLVEDKVIGKVIDLPENKSHNFAIAKIKAIALGNITNQKTLEENIVKPLLVMMC